MELPEPDTESSINALTQIQEGKRLRSQSTPSVLLQVIVLKR